MALTTRINVGLMRRSLGSAQVAGSGGVLTAGPNSTGTCVTDATVGTWGWAHPEYTVSDNGAQAIITAMTHNNQTEYLKATNFGFSFAGTETIKGVLVEAYAWGSGNLGAIKDYSVKLVKAGTISGTSLARTDGFTINNGSSGSVYKTWGDGFSLWGLSLSPSDINDSGFGCALSFQNTDLASRSVLCEHIRMSVFYV